jgi:transposase
MYIQWNKAIGEKNLPTAILRHSYREDGKSKKKTIANLGHCTMEEIKAIELVLKNKGNLSNLENPKNKIMVQQGVSYGASWTVYQIAKKLGIEDALGFDQNGKLALWQVIARTIDQGSRLSAVRMARDEASDEILHFKKGFFEEDLYKNLHWLSLNQEKIEDRLFHSQKKENNNALFLYDLTSSYFEGTQNELAEFGYNRDGKKGKMQITAGLLCNAEGTPVSIECFEGNTKDTATFLNQIGKVKERFGCQKVVFVGDKGMIKSAQIKDLESENFHYITTITKPQIEKLINEKVFQLSFFDVNLYELEHEGIRYIMRKNPVRAEEMAETRQEKEESIKRFLEKQNAYLAEHPKSEELTALKKVQAKINRLRAGKWLSVVVENRTIILKINEEARTENARLDGCYCLKTDIKKEEVDKKIIHERYKDLAKVEQNFRTSKTAHLEMRPFYVDLEHSTRGHLLVCMLSLMIVRELEKSWKSLDLKVEEGLKRLRTLCTTKVEIKDGVSFHQITKPNNQNKELLELAGISLPEVFSDRKVSVDTRKKLINER